jgi:hypothetical protein
LDIKIILDIIKQNIDLSIDLGDTLEVEYGLEHSRKLRRGSEIFITALEVLLEHQWIVDVFKKGLRTL